jgi:flagellin
MRSLDISSENLSDAESRVRNADMAREMMGFTMSNVLQQAAVSMLSQANQMPNNLLQLLR